MELARLNQRQFNRFRDFIYGKCGIRIDEKKITLLSNRIRRRLRAKDLPDFDVYYKYLTSADGAGELDHFLDAITTNETFFFRTEKHFDWLRHDLLNEVTAQQRAGSRLPSLRIWSAGCASGAEPYSIAMSLAENSHRLRNWTLQILGTDISEEALAEARTGVFKPRAIEAVSEKQRRRYFRHLADSDLWQVQPNIKAQVTFARHNLIDAPPTPPFDCIFIRNVLIYFDSKSKQRVISNLIDALANGGYVVVGPSEGIYDMMGPLQRVSPFLYHKRDDSSRGRSGGTG